MKTTVKASQELNNLFSEALNIAGHEGDSDFEDLMCDYAVWECKNNNHFLVSDEDTCGIESGKKLTEKEILFLGMKMKQNATMDKKPILEVEGMIQGSQHHCTCYVVATEEEMTKRLSKYIQNED